jgi:AcrR family transcriptional regulator|tara:strand:- start:1258 stop:1854 length:597 start_codon:yes stop_codon:yes gene_type:complete
MEHLAKQNRSRERINTIINTANEILLEHGVEAITVANIAKYSGLKRTSTYKFFPTPDSLKAMMISRYLDDCLGEFIDSSNNISTDQSSVVVMKCVEILYNFFQRSKGAQILILSNSLVTPVPSNSLHQLSRQIQSLVESNINLPEMFNRDGVFRVFTQIILSILALNAKESGELNEVGKIEAHRAAHAYLLNWINQSS